MSETLNLFFPQWQGSGRWELYDGAGLLYDALHTKIPLIQIPTASTYSLTTRQNILGYSQISSQLADACRVIKTHNPQQIVTIGGDCGVEIAPVSFLHQTYQRDLAIIWLDAHGDLNTPSSSPSAHFHGMPLRVLFGEGDSGIVEQAFSVIDPSQVLIVGAREFDPPERDFIQQKGMELFSAQTINNESHNRIFSSLQSAGFSKLYVHLDLDVIDPREFPHVACPTPHGVRLDALKSLLMNLRKNFQIVGVSVLEFLPADAQNAGVLEVLKLLESVLPLRYRNPS